MKYQNWDKALCIPQGKNFMKKWEYVAGEGTNESLKNKEIVPVQNTKKKKVNYKTLKITEFDAINCDSLFHKFLYKEIYMR